MKLGSSIYHCKKLSSAGGIVKYSQPIEYVTRLGYCSVMPKTGLLATIQYGKSISKVQTIILSPMSFWTGSVKEGDLFYIDAEPTAEELIGTDGRGADYIVEGVLEQNRSILVTVRKRN